MNRVKNYTCVGYSYNDNNSHLLRQVGETHSIDEWLKIAFPSKSDEFLNDYFDGWSAKEIADYLLANMRIRLEEVGGKR